MRQYKLVAGLLAAAVLAGCNGGGSAGNQSTKIKFTSQVSFGDSLSDVGTYAVGGVFALHGGKYTVNTLTPSQQNWTELMAASLGLPAPCAAETGLAGSGTGFNVTPVMHAGCYGYGQGGARVTDPAGIGSATLNPAFGGSMILGQLTVPVKVQIQNHLAAVGGKFTGTEAVFVLAGANDVFANYAMSAVAAGNAAVQTLVTNQITADVTAKVTSDIASHACTPANAQATNCQAQAEGELWAASLGSGLSAAITAQVTADIGAGTCAIANANTTCITQAETELTTAYFSATGGATTAAEGELWQASLGSPQAVAAAVTAQVMADISAGTCAPANAQTTCALNAETELVTAYLTAQGTAAGNAAGTSGPGATAAIAAMAQAGKELAGYVNTQIVGNGANYVTVLNIPDIGTTPFGNSLAPAALALVNSMVQTFNTNLQSNLATVPSILYVDVNNQSHLNTQNPSQYGLTNVTAPACNLSKSVNPLASSLVCTTSNVIPGDISHYLFADYVHPTPYGYSLLAKYTATQMALRGWL